MEHFHTFVDFVLHTKGVEYLIAVGFLLAFIAFFSFLKPRVPVAERAGAVARGADRTLGLLIPENLYYHQGHTWAKVESPELVSVGLDDFAQKLVGNIDKVELPEVGTTLKQGERAWTLGVGSKRIDMLSPINGKVVAVNEALMQSTDAVKSDPYTKGWLVKVKPERKSADLKNLLTGKLARKWIEKVLEDLTDRVDYNLGRVLSDGGIPVDGMAKSIDSENWDALVKEFFLTSDEG